METAEPLLGCESLASKVDFATYLYTKICCHYRLTEGCEACKYNESTKRVHGSESKAHLKCYTFIEIDTLHIANSYITQQTVTSSLHIILAETPSPPPLPFICKV